MASPLGFTLTGVRTPLIFNCLNFFGFAAFYVAFILIMPTIVAISARYRAPEMVLVLHYLTIFSFLLALQLEYASDLPITLGRVARSTLVVRRTTVEKIRDPVTIGGWGCASCVSTAHRSPSQG